MLFQQSAHAAVNTKLVKVLRPTQHKIRHFRDIPQANLLAWYVKRKLIE